QHAVEFARNPSEAKLDGGFTDPMPASTDGKKKPADKRARILHANSKELRGVEDQSVDLVLTDPPYFDNIAYSELSDFFLPWLQLFSLAPSDRRANVALRENLAAKGRGSAAVDRFQQSLTACFKQISRVLKSSGRLVFTYQHRTSGAWYALAAALGA